MMTKNTLHKTGDLIVATSGSYSDYFIDGLFRALKDFDEKDHNIGKDKLYAKYLDLTQLVREGYLEDINYSEMWIGH